MYDVLVVGAGPTGLFMAIELTRCGLRVRVIDNAHEASDKSKAIAIQARTLEIFDQVGIIDAFLEKGLQLKALNLVSDQNLLAHIPLHHLDSPYPFILSLPQYDTEKILSDYLYRLGVEIERGVELISFVEQEDHIIAQLSTNQEEFAWMIGCDGAHSTTRKGLGFSFEGKTFAQIFSIADVQVEWNYPHDEFFLFLNKKSILAAIPLPEINRYRVIFQTEPTVEEVQKLLRQYASQEVKVTQPHWMTQFIINSRITEKYISNRVFLAGDAAHIHSPAGGQGMNTGFADAYNLAWKLAYVHEKKAKISLLQTYDKERRDFGSKLLKATEIASNIAMLRNSFLVGARNLLFSNLTKLESVKKRISKMISQTGYHYKQNLIVGPQGGYRAPNAETNSGDLYKFVRENRGFILINNQEKLDIPNTLTLTHDGTVYDSEEIYVIRPDTMIGCMSKNPNVIRKYFSKFLI